MTFSALAAAVLVALAGCAEPSSQAPRTEAPDDDPRLEVPEVEVPDVSEVPAPEPEDEGGPAASDRLHWSGTVDVTQSMLFLPWETLTIAPGTVVRFHQLPDGDLRATPWVRQADAYIIDNDDPTGHEGYRDSHFSLTGRIVAVGTKEAPILFTSAEAEPGYADWNQLVLLAGSRLENVTTEYTHNGINLQGSGIVLANVVARESLWSCIDVYGADAVLRDIEAYHCWHSAIGFKGTGAASLTDAYTHDSQVGVNCENGAMPTLTRVVVEAAGYPPMCPLGAVTIVPRAADVPGGTYKGELIYEPVV